MLSDDDRGLPDPDLVEPSIVAPNSRTNSESSLICQSIEGGGSATSDDEISEDEKSVLSGNGWDLRLVNLVDRVPNLLKVAITVGDTNVLAVLDTGSMYSLISDSLVSNLGLLVDNNITVLHVLGDREFKTKGCVNLSFAMGEAYMQKVKFSVFEANRNNIGFNLLLGVDFLTQHNMSVFVKEGILSSKRPDGSSVELHLKPNGKVQQTLYSGIKCFAVEDSVLNAGAVTSIAVSYAIPVQDKHLFLYTDDAVELSRRNDVRGLAGITTMAKKRVLLAGGEKDSKVVKGQLLGALSSVVELPEDDEENPNIEEEEPLMNVNLSGLSTQQQSRVLDMLTDVRIVFSTSEMDVGHANVTEHTIRLADETPIFQRPRRLPPPVAEEIERQCQELHSLDVIEPSVSPWNSPIVPVTKKGGGLRICLDYRKLNKVTVPDRHPVPNLLDSLFGLHGTVYFTRLDLVKSYYQIPIDSDSRQCTAFSTHKSHWQFKRLSFGLRNAPAAFQREIQAVLRSFPSNKVVAYLDDILIMSKSFEEHIKLVEKVLKTLAHYRLKINPNKCEFFKHEVQFLGHIVSQTGIGKTPEYVAKVSGFPRPQTKGELREFLGFINFQRKFLPNCSAIQKPLSCQTSGRRNCKLEWSNEMNDAFEMLKDEMKKEVELAYPDYSSEAEKIELWVDASDVGEELVLI